MIMKPQKAVFLIGSPRGKKSASRALAERLMAGLSGRGVASEIHSLTRAVESEEKAAAMLEAVEKTDILVFSFPLYVDQLPAPVVWTLERIAERRKQGRSDRHAWLAAIVQSGFPETHQNLPAVEIMRRFAESSGFRWAGGLAMGMGGAAGGQDNEKREGMLRNVFRGLDLAAVGLSQDRPIPGEAVSLFARKLMPHWLYFLMANFGWRQQARKHAKTKREKIDLYARPYAE
jgi:NAD(P)H-dependent FMN reductase